MKPEKRKWSTRDIAELGVMIAALEAGKLALSSLPNVEIVTFLLIMFTLTFGWKSIVAAFAFVGVECLIWPIQLWVFMYLYIWPLLVLLTMLFRKQSSIWFWSIFSGLYGLCFGGLCSIVYIFTSGIHTAVTWWIAGIPFDLVHGISNFFVMLLLYLPMHKVFQRYRRTRED